MSGEDEDVPINKKARRELDSSGVCIQSVTSGTGVANSDASCILIRARMQSVDSAPAMRSFIFNHRRDIIRLFISTRVAVESEGRSLICPERLTSPHRRLRIVIPDRSRRGNEKEIERKRRVRKVAKGKLGRRFCKFETPSFFQPRALLVLADSIRARDSSTRACCCSPLQRSCTFHIFANANEATPLIEHETNRQPSAVALLVWTIVGMSPDAEVLLYEQVQGSPPE
jgi:hypothetical protein